MTMSPQARRLLSWVVGGYQGSWCDLRCSTTEGSCELQVGAVWGPLTAVPLAGSLQSISGAWEPSSSLGPILWAVPQHFPQLLQFMASSGAVEDGTEEFSVEQLVQQILDTHPTKPAPEPTPVSVVGALVSDPDLGTFLPPRWCPYSHQG